MPVAWCLRNADLAVHKPRMKPTHPEGLNRRLLAKRSKLTVQLTEQRKIRPGNRRKHEEQTRRDQSDHSIAPILKRSLNPLWARVGVVLADHRHQGIAVAGLAAGGHWDPDETGQHLGPFGNGHRGDLSRLVVDDDGKTNTSVVAPRLSTADLKGKALIVHAGGDTYRDEPPLGGGGARVACGVVPDER